MAENSLSVKVTADVSNLQAKIALAQAELRNFNTETRRLATEAAAAGDAQRSSLIPALEAAAGRAAATRAEITRFRTELGQIKPASEGAFNGLRDGFKLSGENLDHLSFQIRDFTGLFSRMGETLAAGFAAEKIIGLAEAFAQYGAQISRAMEQTGMTAQQLSSLDVVAKENDVDFQTLSRTMTIFAKNIQEAQLGTIKQALSFQALGISQKELTEHGNDMGYMLQRVAQALSQYENGQQKLALETNIFGGRVQGLSAILKDIAENGMAGVQRHAKELGVDLSDNAAKGAEQADKSFKDLGVSLDALKRALGESWSIKGLTDAVTGISVWLAKGQNDLNKFRQLGIGETISSLNQSGKTIPIPGAGESGAGSAGKSAPALPDISGEVAKMRADSAQIAGTWDGLQSGMLAKQRATVEQTRQLLAQQLGDLKEKSTDYQSVVQEEARLDAQIRKTSGEEAIASTREEMSGINAQSNVGTLQRLQQERSSLDQLLASHKLTAAQVVEVTRERNQLIASINREALSEQTQISQIDTQTQIQVSRLQIEAKKASLEADLTNNKINADQKYAVLKDLTTREFNLDRQSIEDRLKLLNEQPVEQARVNGELKVLWEKYYEDLARLDQQRATEQRKAQADEVKGWKSAVGEITSAEKSFLSDYLTGRKTAGQSIIELADNLALKEIQNDAAALTQRLLLHNTAAAADKATEQGGFLFHLLMNNQKAASEVASQATQTSAVAAGTAARTGIESTAAVASKAASAEAGSTTVMQDAAKAFSGTYASVAQIPYVGWILAPAAAAAAFAAVAGYEAIASSAGGDWQVDSDRLNFVHKNETILPASVAAPMRDFFGSGSQSTGGGGGNGISVAGDAHFHVGSLPSNLTPSKAADALFTAVRNGNPKIRQALQGA